jgi:hypothetical protein
MRSRIYAILSHRWGANGEEVTFKGLIDGTDEGKAGYNKIRLYGEQARRDGWQYFWVDTCCTMQAHYRRQCPAKKVVYTENDGSCHLALTAKLSQTYPYLLSSTQLSTVMVVNLKNNTLIILRRTLLT